MRLHPFRAVTYDRRRVGDLSAVVTQPYDKIDDALQATYLARHPANYVRVIRGKAEPGDAPAPAPPGKANWYTRARDTVAAWLRDGTLRRDDTPALWVYGVDFTTPDGATRTRLGVVALADLEEYGKGSVKPHEKTLAGPKADRLNLIRELRGHFEQIFFLFDDAQRRADAVFAEVAAGPPDLEAREDEGHRHRLWAVRDAKRIAAIRAAVEAGTVIIADGHHRYETALTYRREVAQRPCSEPETPGRILGIFVNMSEPGLVILPTHRTVRGLPAERWQAFWGRLGPLFEVTELPPADAAAALLAPLAKLRGEGRRGTVIVRAGERPRLVALPRLVDPASRIAEARADAWKRLDVTVLHKLLLEPHLGIDPRVLEAGETVGYYRDPSRALVAVATGAAQAAFLLNPTTMTETREVSLAGETMPQKSTDFYPKLLSGLVAAKFAFPE